MGRKRKSNPHHLPPNMYLKGRSIWISLGPDKKMRNIGLMSPETIRYGEQLLSKKSSANTVEIIAAMMELKKSEVSPGSFKQYRSTQKFCEKHFRLMELEKINSAMFIKLKTTTYLNRPRRFNKILQFMGMVFKFAIECQVVAIDVTASVQPMKIKTRKVLIESSDLHNSIELMKNSATPIYGCVMEMLYLTGQRLGDVLNIKWKDVRDGHIYFKTQKRDALVAIEISQSIKFLLSEIKRINGDFVCERMFHKRGREISKDVIGHHHRKALKLLGVDSKNFNRRDVRPKSATDVYLQTSEKSGEQEGLKNAKALLGHTNFEMTEHYLKKRIHNVGRGPEVFSKNVKKLSI